MSDEPMTEEELSALAPWQAEAEKRLEGITDLEQAAAIYRDLGVDEGTASKLAALHCGGSIEDRVGPPQFWPPGSGLQASLTSPHPSHIKTIE